MAINARELEGRAIKGTGPSVYLVTGGAKYGFASWNAWLNYGLSTPSNVNNWTTVSDADLNSIPNGPGRVNDQGQLVSSTTGQILGNGKTINIIMNGNISPPGASSPFQRIAPVGNPMGGGVPSFNNNMQNNGRYSYSDVQRLATQLAREQVVRQQQEALRRKRLGHVFTTLKAEDDVLENQRSIITNGLFSNDSATLSTAFTSSLQTTSSKQYYYEVWDSNPVTTTTAKPQFSVAYGHRLGSGSATVGTLNDSPTRAIYSQYKLLLLEPEDNSFTFKDGTSSDSIYAINFNRARVKERLDPGNWQITLGQLSGSTVPNNSHTGSNVKIQTSNPSFISLIDDSNDYYNVNEQGIAGTIYSVVSGSLANGIHNPSAPHYYGLVYPNTGTIVLNDNVLNKSCSFNSVTGSNTAGDNAWKLFTSISGAMSANSSTNAFQARNVETITSTHYFIRVKNGEYNFSNNPTYVTGSNGDIAQGTFINDPKTYITTVGLYNNSQELLAVGKLSKAIQKSFAKESLIKVRLDY